MYIQYRLNKNLEPNINFHGLEIPSEFTIAKAHWSTPKIARTFSPPGPPVKSNSSKKELKARKVSFNDNVTIHQYDIESDCSSSSICSEDINRDIKNNVTSTTIDENDILCPESPEEKCPDEKSDYLFNSDTESESETESFDLLRGKRAKKGFKVKFGQIP